MAQCSLRAAYKLDPTMSVVPQGPRSAALLGTAAHRLAEEATLGHFGGAPNESRAGLERRWDQLIARSVEQLSAYTWLGPIPSPDRWRNYQRTRIRAIALVADQLRRRPRATEARVEVEKRLRSDIPPLVGQIDRLEVGAGRITIVDIKSSTPAAELSPPYRIQLLMYAALLKAAEGTVATHVAIQYLDGTRTEIGVDWAEVRATVDAALAARTTIDDARRQGRQPPAHPGVATCRYCPYKVVCPAFLAAESDIKRATGVVAARVVEVATNQLSVLVDPGTGLSLRLLSPPLAAVVRPGEWLTISGGSVAASGLDLRTTWESTAVVWEEGRIRASLPLRLEAPAPDGYSGEVEEAAESLDAAQGATNEFPNAETTR